MKSKLRLTFFVLVAFIQLAVAGAAIYKSELALRTGMTFRFRIQPVDPVDAFRGRYVAIRFGVESAPVAEGVTVRPKKPVFIPIEVGEDGYASFGFADIEAPQNGAYLRLRAGVVTRDDEGRMQVWVATPFRRFYMNEKLAPEAERAVWAGPRGKREASVSVRIRDGVGVIEELYIDGVPIHQWLAENS